MSTFFPPGWFGPATSTPVPPVPTPSGPTYSYATAGDVITQLSETLKDANNVFWTRAELLIYINAALREWNSMSRMFRDRGMFVTNTADIFYDLRTVLFNGNGELFLAPVISDAQLITQARFMLMETGVSYSDGLLATEVADAFVDRRNQFLLETGLVITQPTPQVVVSGTGRIQFASDSVIDVRRAHWISQSGTVRTLFREDEHSAQSFAPTWPQAPGTPRRFSIFPDPLLTLQLLPPPVDSGTLVLQTISSGSVLDDFTPFILWGVLADVLSNTGPQYDPIRSAYCLQRYSEGVIIAKMIATVQQAFINDRPVATSSAFDLDSFRPNWQIRGTPRKLGMLGSNLACVADAANGVYSVLMDAVRNAPQLATEAALIPIGREYVDILLGYACHLATFKQGGNEFQASMGQYQTFVKAAVGYNNRMSGQNINFETLVDRALKQENQVPLRQEVAA